jgi:plastocyanin
MRGRLARAGIASAILFLGVPALPAAAGGGGGCVGVQTVGGATRVVMHDACFTPTIARVPIGATVTWVNKDPYQHTVTAAGLVFGTAEPFGLDATTKARFSRAGVYPYYCTIHVGMAGAIIAGSDAELAAALGRATVPVAENVSSGIDGAPVGDAAKAPVAKSGSAWPALAAAIGLGSVGLGFGAGRRNRNGHAPGPTT